MTDKQFDKEIKKLALDFEKQIENGLLVDSSITLSQFVDRWFEEYGNYISN